jgi:predicted outer membrane repeat protein
VLAANSFLRMDDVAISASSAVRGGGMRIDRGVAYVDGSSFRNNSATVSGGGVEGFNNEMLSITHSTVSGNSAGNFGGGIFADRTLHVQIASSLISGNVAAYGAGSGYAGGGVAVVYAQDCGAISNSTITGNFAAQGGGGIALINPPGGSSLCKYTQMVNDTIVGNATQDGSGNGIFAQGSPYSNIYDSIVANNFSPGDNSDLAGGFAACENFIKTPGASTIVPTISGCPGNNIGVDPLLGPLRVNGGPTLSMLPDPASPVIDAGGLMIHLATDQRDLPRAGVADIGAIERQFPEDLIFRNGFDSS